MRKEEMSHGSRMRMARKHCAKPMGAKIHDAMHNGEKRMKRMEEHPNKNRPSTMTAKARERRSGGMERHDHDKQG